MADSTLLLDAGDSAQWSSTFRDQAGVPIASALITSITLTLYDLKTGQIINGRNAVTVQNTNGGSIHATSGLFTMTFSPGDSAIVTTTEAEEHHEAIIQVTWIDGGANEFIQFWVRNRALGPHVAPDLQENALLTLAEARAAIKVTTAENNAELARLINVVSDRFETETARRLKSRVYPAAQMGAAGEPILPEVEWPITTLTAVTVAGTLQTQWMPGDAGNPDDFDVVLLDTRERRHLFRRAGWGSGVAHITLHYTAGYGVDGTAIPADLREGALQTLRHFWYLTDRQQAAVASRSAGAETITYLNTALPAEVWPVLRAYRRWD